MERRAAVRLLHSGDIGVAGDDGTGWVGAIAPVDTSDAALHALTERLQTDSRIQPLSVAFGNFP